MYCSKDALVTIAATLFGKLLSIARTFEKLINKLLLDTAQNDKRNDEEELITEDVEEDNSNVENKRHSHQQHYQERPQGNSYHLLFMKLSKQ